jgi:hypothetical protein
VKRWSRGQLASLWWRGPELRSRVAALFQAVNTKWCLTNTRLRYIHRSTKFQLRPSLPQLQIVWYRCWKHSFPCQTSILLLVLLLIPLSSLSSMLLLRFMIVFLLQYICCHQNFVYYLVVLVLGTNRHNLMKYYEHTKYTLLLLYRCFLSMFEDDQQYCTWKLYRVCMCI